MEQVDQQFVADALAQMGRNEARGGSSPKSGYRMVRESIERTLTGKPSQRLWEQFYKGWGPKPNPATLTALRSALDTAIAEQRAGWAADDEDED